MLFAVNDVQVIVGSANMRFDMYHCSGSPAARYESTRANADKALMRLEGDATNVNK